MNEKYSRFYILAASLPALSVLSPYHVNCVYFIVDMCVCVSAIAILLGYSQSVPVSVDA